MQRAQVPERFTYEFLKQLGFASSSDRPMLAVLKALRFLSDSGEPLERYRRFRDPAQAGVVLAEALRDAYADVFAVDQRADRLPQQELRGLFARLSGKGESATEKMAATFKTLATRANFDAVAMDDEVVEVASEPQATPAPAEPAPSTAPATPQLALRHDVHVHLPNTSDVAVFDAIFQSLRNHLLT
jgi:hypothetical protein